MTALRDTRGVLTLFLTQLAAVAMACGSATWTRPQPLLVDTRQLRATRFPSVAAGGAGGARLFIVGNDVPFFDTSAVPRATLTAIEVGRRPVPAPDGDFRFALPRITATESGRIEMLWAEGVRSSAAKALLTNPKARTSSSLSAAAALTACL